jgi:hypothetical protein
MLGHRTREPFMAPEHDQHVLKGGGMVRPVVLNGGAASATWSLRKGSPKPTWFGRPAPAPAPEFGGEARDIERFLTSSPGGSPGPASRPRGTCERSTSAVGEGCPRHQP